MKGYTMSKIQWVGDKRQQANEKHFNGALSATQLDDLVTRVIKGCTHVGYSDRSNGPHGPAKILWGQFTGRYYGLILDAKAVAAGKVLIVSFYDLNPDTIATKAKRFNMRAKG
jgi:hypothetical protein